MSDNEKALTYIRESFVRGSGIFDHYTAQGRAEEFDAVIAQVRTDAARDERQTQGASARPKQALSHPDGYEAAKEYLEQFLSSVDAASDIDAAWLADDLLRTLEDSLVDEPDPCHCGRPVRYGFDGDPTHHRGMCEDCDSVRCDAYPLECPHRGGTIPSDQRERIVATAHDLEHKGLGGVGRLILRLLEENERLEKERNWNWRSSRAAKKRAIKAEATLSRVRDVVSIVKTDIEAFTYPEEVAGAVEDALDAAPEDSGLVPRDGQQVIRAEIVRIGGGKKVRAEFLADEGTSDEVIHEHAVKALAQAVERLSGE